MIVLGINSGFTRLGRPLNDGGACLVRDGKIVAAIQEERLTRKKYAGGFDKSIDYVCKCAGISYDAIDLIVVSSCIDKIWSAEEAVRLLKLKERCGFDIDRVLVLDHHLSHAYGGFISSGFPEALVCVMDNMGNKISGDDSKLWGGSFERSSYYKAFWKNGKPQIELLERDADSPAKIGYGEAFRYFTHYFGWDSYEHAGKTMCLSAYGNPKAFGGVKLFSDENGEEVCDLGAKHENPISEIAEFFKKSGKRVPPRPIKGKILQDHKDMANLLQKEFENSLMRKIKRLIAMTGIGNIVISGGVGLNCLVNGRIAGMYGVNDVYVPFAPGDEGQSVGNALYGYYSKAKGQRHKPVKASYFGKTYTDGEWMDYAKEKGLEISRSASIEKDSAELLAKGKVIGWFQGASEFGPRALGHRSILADPRDSAMKGRINSKIKRREMFQPFAPSFLEEYQKEYFDISNVKSYFMSFAISVKENKRLEIPAVVHVDGTARLQTVTKDTDKRYRTLLDEFRKLTGMPCLLNTSFNLNKEPIVETPKDAIDTFLKCDLDCLVIGDYLLKKTSS